MDRNGVFVATILASVIGTLVMALVANVPYAVAPGMGLNAFLHLQYADSWDLNGKKL